MLCMPPLHPQSALAHFFVLHICTCSVRGVQCGRGSFRGRWGRRLVLRLGERCWRACYPPSPHPPNSELPARCSCVAYCCIVLCTLLIMYENIPLLVGPGGRMRACGGGVKSAKLGRRLAPPPYRPPQYSAAWKYIVVVVWYVWVCVHERNKAPLGQSGVNRHACGALPFCSVSRILPSPTSGPLRQLCCQWVGVWRSSALRRGSYTCVFRETQLLPNGHLGA